MFSIADVSAFFTPGVCMMGTPNSLVRERMHPNHSRRGGRVRTRASYLCLCPILNLAATCFRRVKAHVGHLAV